MAYPQRLRQPFPWGKLRQLRVHRITGRFRPCRRIGTWIRHRLAPAASISPEPSAVTGLSVDAAAEDLRAHGFHSGYRLPLPTVAEIVEFARRTPCLRAYDEPDSDDGERFLITEIRNGHTPGGAPVAVADVDLSHACPAVDAVSRDAGLLAVAKCHLGHPPTDVAARLYWSPASALSDEFRRRNAQTIDFHYDIDPVRSLYFYFYLTPTDRGSGAHAVLPGTHRAKPLPILLDSTFQSEERLRAFYPEAKPVIIEGDAGFGFVEDPACFHKALVPGHGNRLVLQLRYS